MVYPWQNKQWLQLQQSKQENRLPHALLFAGLRGTGKAYFAECFIRLQLCQHTGPVYHSECECHSCRLVNGKSHPNILWIEPEKAGGAIKIDQIRNVAEFIQHTSLQGEYRFVVINPANNMNVNAANALLKTLEEPSSGAITILIAEQASHLPATVLSRCQHIYFPTPETDIALQWLAHKLPSTANHRLVLRLANGAPLAAIQLVESNILAARENLLEILYALSQKQADPLKSAASIQDMDTLHILDFTLTFIMDLVRYHLADDVNEVANQDFIQQIIDLRKRTTLQKVIQYLDYLLQLRGQQQTGINLNKQLMLEGILIRWMECS